MAGNESDRFTPVVPFERSFDALYGLESVESAEDGVILGRVRVGRELLTADGLLHGGVPAAIAESLASQGTALAVVGPRVMPSGLSNDTTVTAPVREGATVHAEARALSRADDYWVWSVQLRDDDGTLCAFSRVTIAVRPLRRPAPIG